MEGIQKALQALLNESYWPIKFNPDFESIGLETKRLRKNFLKRCHCNIKCHSPLFHGAAGGSHSGDRGVALSLWEPALSFFEELKAGRATWGRPHPHLGGVGRSLLC
jgi:hypothetical protein